jgi:tryptophan synthase alpha chain
MNKLQQTFRDKAGNILSIYFSAGYPNLDSTATIIKQLEAEGVDFLEVGIPFSDPLADGPTIQESGSKALENGMSLKLLMNQLKAIKDEINIPLIMMGYWNSILNYGVENFLKDCQEIGIAGTILPDLPLNAYQDKYQSLFEQYNIPMIFLVSPTTSEARIRMIDSVSKGFVYAVSSASTTGSNKGILDAEAYLAKIKSYNLTSPVMTGFNIKTKADIEFASKYTNGAIIGSAFIKAIGQPGELTDNITSFIKPLR